MAHWLSLRQYRRITDKTAVTRSSKLSRRRQSPVTPLVIHQLIDILRVTSRMSSGLRVLIGAHLDEGDRQCPFRAELERLPRGLVKRVVMMVVAGMPRFSNSTSVVTRTTCMTPNPPTGGDRHCTSFAISAINASVRFESCSLARIRRLATP